MRTRPNAVVPRPLQLSPKPSLRIPCARAITLVVLVACSRIAVASVPMASGPGDFGVDVQQFRDPEPRDVEAEYRIKAAVLYNFIKYTEWPASAFEDEDTPLTIRVVGKDPFGAVLDDTFEGKELHGRRIVIQRSEAVPKAVSAHLVFVGELGTKERKRLLEIASNRPTLLVGERAGLAAAGATVNLYIEEERLRFEINTEAAQASGLEISSELLKLARIVRTERRERP